MGNRIYFDQMLQDACQHHQLHITDVIDIATVKDFMKVIMLHVIVKYYNSGIFHHF